MNKFAAIFLLTVSAGNLWGQLVPNSNQSFQLAPAYNPAFTGVEGFTSVKIGYRNQWTSFPGAPSYLNLVVATRIKQPADVTHNALSTGSTAANDNLPARKRTIHGLGFTLTNETYGTIENIDVGVTWSFHYPLSKKLYLAAGISPAYSNTRIQLNKLQTRDPDRFIEYLQTNGASNSLVNVKSGVLLYASSFYVQASYLQTWTQVVDESVSNQGYRYIASAGAGVSVPLNPTTTLKPSVSFLMDEYNDLVIDYSAKMYLGTQAWGGLVYRDTGFGVIILGFELNHLVGVSYSYEVSTGGLRTFNNGSHEFILGLKLGNLRKLKPYVW